MTNARYQVEILTKDGWKIVGRSKTEQGAENQAKQAMKAVPSATDYRIIDRHEKQFEGTAMKKYQKRSELQEKTALGYKTLIDEFDMDNVNDALAKVPGMEFALHLGSKSPRPIKGGGHSMLKIEDINESVAQITGGMDGLFETVNQKKKK